MAVATHELVQGSMHGVWQREAALGAAAEQAPREGSAAPEDPDAPLVERWRSGDEAAFELLVRRHERRIFGLLVRMLGSREEAEDVAQETLLNLHRHGHRFRREARFSTFVYRVAVNAALNRRRSLGRRRSQMEGLRERHEAGEDLPAAPRGPESSTLGREVRERVEQEIRALSPTLRAPVVLFDLEGLAYGEIARILELAEGTVKSRIHRGRQVLRRRLRDLVVEERAPAGGEEAARC